MSLLRQPPKRLLCMLRPPQMNTQGAMLLEKLHPRVRALLHSFAKTMLVLHLWMKTMPLISPGIQIRSASSTIMQCTCFPFAPANILHSYTCGEPSADCQDQESSVGSANLRGATLLGPKLHAICAGNKAPVEVQGHPLLQPDRPPTSNPLHGDEPAHNVSMVEHADRDSAATPQGPMPQPSVPAVGSGS